MKNKLGYWIVIAAAALLQVSCNSQTELLYVGTYSERGSQGLYVYEYERSDNAFTLVQTLPEISDPNFLAVHPDGKKLYCVNTMTDEEGNRIDGVSSFGISSSGQLTLLNQMPSYGRGACHITLDKEGKYIYVAHYGSGSMTSFKINNDGTIEDTIQTMQFSGSSITRRQQGPHLHSMLFDPGNKYLYAADLGTDKVMIFDFDPETGNIDPAPQPWVEVIPGSGPRHFTFNQDGTVLYLAEELSSTVSLFRVNPLDGSLSAVQTLSTLPEGFEGQSSVADIHMDKEERMVFVTNRGHNSLAYFSVLDDGTLEATGHQPVLGDHPRNFMVDPKGEFVLVANRNTDNINQFRFDVDADSSWHTGTTLEVPAPVCLKWLNL
ncbi:MAG: lactonase family protein [Bacteroidales bacterium]